MRRTPLNSEFVTTHRATFAQSAHADVAGFVFAAQVHEAPEAQAAAREDRLDDHQSALLEIANLPTPAAQLKAVKEIAERKSAERASRVSAAAASNKEAATKIGTIKTKIEKKAKEVGQLKEELSADRKELSELEDKLADSCADATVDDDVVESPTIAPGDSLDRLPAAEEQSLSDEDRTALATLMAAWESASVTVRACFLATVWGSSSALRH
jgi:hypothetical protein